MLTNPFLAQQLKEEHVKDRLREAEQAWLLRAAKNAALTDKPSSRGLVGRLHDLFRTRVFVYRVRSALAKMERFARDSGQPSAEYQ